jgi:small subunit ribosomal protein S20
MNVLYIYFKEVKSLPNIKSAKKRVLITSVKTLQNKMLKTSLKTAIKKYDAALAAGDKTAAAETYKAAVKKIDRAVSRGILHKNNAARKKSQFTTKLNALGA